MRQHNTLQSRTCKLSLTNPYFYGIIYTMINGKVGNTSVLLRGLYHTFLVLSSIFLLSTAQAGDYDKERAMVVPLLDTYQLYNSESNVFAERKVAGCSAVRIAPEFYLTAGHCVGYMTDANQQRVPNFDKKYTYLVDGVEKTARLVKVNYAIDLALLETEGGRPDVGPVATLLVNSTLDTDTPVFAVGFPVGEDTGSIQILTFGNYQGRSKLEPEKFVFTANIAPGNSGGGVFTITGDLVGLVVGQADYGDGMFIPYQRVWYLNTAVAADVILDFLKKEQI